MRKQRSFWDLAQQISSVVGAKVPKYVVLLHRPRLIAGHGIRHPEGVVGVNIDGFYRDISTQQLDRFRKATLFEIDACQLIETVGEGWFDLNRLLIGLYRFLQLALLFVRHAQAQIQNMVRLQVNGLLVILDRFVELAPFAIVDSEQVIKFRLDVD